MCLVLFAWHAHADWPLVLAANRDEFHARPSTALHWWQEGIAAGRDEQAGGTWLGATREGRFAALTNYRDPRRWIADAPPRGALVHDFLLGGLAPRAYLERLAAVSGRYNDFNLLCGTPDEAWVFSSRRRHLEAIAPGLHGLSNANLDTPWPKVLRGRKALSAALATLPDAKPLFAALADTEPAAPDALPDTGVGPEWERLLSPAFIRAPGYGTRCSTVLLIAPGSGQMIERSFGANGARGAERELSWNSART